MVIVDLVGIVVVAAVVVVVVLTGEDGTEKPSDCLISSRWTRVFIDT